MEYYCKKYEDEVGTLPEKYRSYIGRKVSFILISILLTGGIFLYSLSVGNADLTIFEITRTILGMPTELEHAESVIWNLRIPVLLLQ